MITPGQTLFLRAPIKENIIGVPYINGIRQKEVDSTRQNEEVIFQFTCPNSPPGSWFEFWVEHDEGKTVLLQTSYTEPIYQTRSAPEPTIDDDLKRVRTKEYEIESHDPMKVQMARHRNKFSSSKVIGSFLIPVRRRKCSDGYNEDCGCDLD